MQNASTTPNPFALMLDPAAVLLAVENSPRLGHLQRQVYRPLDKPLIPRVGADVAAFDVAVDDAGDEATELDD